MAQTQTQVEEESQAMAVAMVKVTANEELTPERGVKVEAATEATTAAKVEDKEQATAKEEGETRAEATPKAQVMAKKEANAGATTKRIALQRGQQGKATTQREVCSDKTSQKMTRDTRTDDGGRFLLFPLQV